MIRALIASLLAAPALLAVDTAAYFQPWHITAAAISPNGAQFAYLRVESGRTVTLVRVSCDQPGSLHTLTFHPPRRARQDSPPASRGGKGKKGSGAPPSFPSSGSSSSVRASFAFADQALRWTGPSTIVATLPPLKPVSVDTEAMKVLGDFDGKAPKHDWSAPAQVQLEMAAKLPERRVEVLGADDVGRMFLALATGPEEPGRYFIYDRQEHLMAEFARRAPGLKYEDIAQVLLLGMPSAPGRRLVFTLPRQPPRPVLPLVLLCPGPGKEAPSEQFERGPQALAAAGFAVLEVNSSDPEALWAAVGSLRHGYPVVRGPLDLLGLDRGGSIVARFHALHPEEVFRVAVLDSTVDPAKSYPQVIRSLEGLP